MTRTQRLKLAKHRRRLRERNLNYGLTTFADAITISLGCMTMLFGLGLAVLIIRAHTGI